MQLEMLLYQLKRKRGCLARYSSIIHGGLAHKAQGRVQVPRFPKQGSDIELRSRDLHAKQSTRYFIEPSEYITGSVYISIPGPGYF